MDAAPPHLDGSEEVGRRQAGLGLVSLLVTLGILGLLALIAVKAIPSTPSATGGTSSDTGASLIHHAGDTVAQANVMAAVSVVAAAAITDGGYGGVQAASLTGSSPGVVFTTGPSTNASHISLASGAGPPGGVTLAVRSTSGTCWLVWTSSATSWYGAETGHACVAPALGSPPGPGVAANGGIDWQSGGFPTT
jgi:hypothetical protein